MLRRRLRPRIRLRYLWWRLTHRGGGYGAFYSRMIRDSLARGVPHRTLGIRRWTATAAPAWARLEFRRRGTEILPDLAAFGLAKSSTCVDYGCGSLRIGQHLIHWLAPECYCGLDVTDTFFRPALEALPPELLASRRPRVAVIDEDALAALERRPPDLVFSYAVLKHVPPRELDAFFDRFMRLVGPSTVALLYFPDAPKSERVGPMSWTHPAERLIGMALARRSAVSVGVTRIGEDGEGRRRHPRSLLWIAGAAVDRPMPARLLLPQGEALQSRLAFMKASNASL